MTVCHPARGIQGLLCDSNGCDTVKDTVVGVYGFNADVGIEQMAQLYRQITCILSVPEAAEDKLVYRWVLGNSV